MADSWLSTRRLCTAGLPLESAPLLLYYSFMNAAKALLSAKAIPFSPRHGVTVHNIRAATSKISLSNEGVKIQGDGIVPALAGYYQETDPARDYTMKELLFNMPFIHRTYCLTYRSQKQMFIPLRDCRYVFDANTATVFCHGMLASEAVESKLKLSLPSSLIWIDTSAGQFRSQRSIAWSDPSRAAASELTALQNLHSTLRIDLAYISGTQALWYVKANVAGPRRMLRHVPTIVLLAMHRMSEICRYRPNELSSYLDGQNNWLLSEFVSMSPEQFLDEISSEITGHQFLEPNIRPPT